MSSSIWPAFGTIAGLAVLLALDAGCGGGSSGTSPVPGAIATPSGPIGLNTNGLSFIAAGSPNAQAFTASESGYSGTFTESDTCHPAAGTIATVAPANANGPSATFTVTPQSAGSCAVTVTDAYGQTSAVTVGVTITQGMVN